MLPLSSFAPRLITWQRTHGRHDLPWQRTRDAYVIWLSEIMLQQTQVATVVPYYERFLARFPNVAALAAAPLDEVMALWSGLGYYSRARNLHRCAGEVVTQYGGSFPNDAVALATLPGIGRSTAAAIAAFAFGAHETILDGNVKRVLTRVFGIEGVPSEKRVENTLWELAESLLPTSEIEAYTQGLMDLGATLCVRGRPHCTRCPFAQKCVAHLTGRERELPTPKPKKVLPQRQTLMLVLCDGESILLERRPPTGIWGGLWSLPEALDEGALAACATHFGVTEPLQPLASFTHTFTHFQLTIEPRLAIVNGCGSSRYSVADNNYAWVPLHDTNAYGLPTPVRRLTEKLKDSLDRNPIAAR